MTDEQWTPRPARGYSWPPFEKGHTHSLVHGAQSERTIAAKAAEVHTRLLVVAPWLDEPVFAPAVARYLRAEARGQLLQAFIAECVDRGGAGKVPVRIWESATAADRLAAQLGDELGLSPRGRAEVRRAVAAAEIAGASILALAEQGRLIRQRRQAAEAEAVEVSEAVEAGEVSP